MPKSPRQSRAQLVLALERQNSWLALEPNPKGLVETLADLLLESLGIDGSTMEGGNNEHQDHA
jgi:hypothetical protein